MEIDDILLNENNTPEEKVYYLAKTLRSVGRCDDMLWRAIVDMKNKNFPNIDQNFNDY